ncbi:MAG TPA: hypothetical protein VKZ18_15985 [Polyangia bacterium]|nr:hypothetical protein [Polyangia bacterium]
MSYLYGDSTPSKLEVNYIEFLRDAVDCCAQVLLADERIAEGVERTRALEVSTSAEIAKLQKLGGLVPKTFEGTPVGEPGSPTARCVADIVGAASDIVRTAVAEANAMLETAATRRDAEAAIERAAFVSALEGLLIKHDLPDMTSDCDVALATGGRYACQLLVTTPYAIDARLTLEVPAGHLFEKVIRLDRLAERLDVQVPEMAGWLHKEVKLRTQHLEKHHLTGFSAGPAGSTLQLRLAPERTGAGYDVIFSDGSDAATVRLVRIDEQQKAEPPFDAQEADAVKLRALRDKVAAAVAELSRYRTKILEAKLEGEPVQTHATPSLLVERLVAVMVPETREIAARSQSPGELVLRRAIGGDRREEIFLPKQDLKAKIALLNEGHRAMFEALLSDGPAAPRVAPSIAPTIRPDAVARPEATGASRPATPLYGLPTLSAPPPAAAPTPPAPPPAAPAPFPTPTPFGASSFPAPTPFGGAPPPAPPARRVAASALDRPPPAPPTPAVAGEIDGTTDGTPEEKRGEPSGPIPAA